MLSWFAEHYPTFNSTSSLVILSGGSAGGLGVFSNIDFVADRLVAKVIGAPVGGYVPRVEWYTGSNHNTPAEDVRDVAFIAHTRLFASSLPVRCLAAISSTDAYKCIIPRLAWPHYHAPLFVIEALTDACVICKFEGVGDSPDACWVPPRLHFNWPQQIREYVSAYGRNATTAMGQILATPSAGLFVASCFLHCGFTLKQPLINGTAAVDALHRWALTHSRNASVQNDGATNFKWIDNCTGGSYWPPCNPMCPFNPSQTDSFVANTNTNGII